MSIHAITAVLDFAPTHWIPATRMVALALADRVNAEGLCWPSLADIQRRTGLSERWVRYQLRIIEADGWIECPGQRPSDSGRPVSNLWIWRKWLQVGGHPSAPKGGTPQPPTL